MPRPCLTWKLSSGQGSEDHSAYIGEPCQEEALRTVHKEKVTVGPQESLPIPIVGRIRLGPRWSTLVSVSCSLGRREEYFSWDVQRVSRRNSIANIINCNVKLVMYFFKLAIYSINSLQQILDNTYQTRTASEYSPVGEEMRGRIHRWYDKFRVFNTFLEGVQMLW